MGGNLVWSPAFLVAHGRRFYARSKLLRPDRPGSAASTDFNSRSEIFWGARMTKQAQATELLKATDLSYREIARRVGCSLQTVRIAAWVLRGKHPMTRIAP